MNRCISKSIHSFLLVFFLGHISLSLYAETTVKELVKKNPDIYLKEVASSLISAIKSNKKQLKTDETLAKRLVTTHLLPAIDTYGFAKRTLGKKTWNSITKEQKSRFVQAFIALVIISYAKGLSLYDNQDFQFNKTVFLKSGKAKVSSFMQGKSKISIEYLLAKTTGSWKITNLKIDGINMAKSYKKQFLVGIKSMGIEKFIIDLEKKTKK
jgi:phospholipid transport system substrate-binding protein